MAQMWKVEEIAKELKVHPQTVYRWIYTGKLEALKIDGILRITDEAYKEFTSKHFDPKKGREG